MRVAVTGGTGFVGRYLFSHVPHGIEPVVLSRQLPSGDNSSFDSSLEYRQCDYSYNMFVETLKGCDAVIHMAAKRSVYQVGMPDNQNLVIDHALFAACNQLNISNVVFCSSRGVYGYKGAPWNEHSTVSPLSLYALSKLQSEAAAGYYNNMGMCIKSLRVAQVLGYGENERTALTHFIQAALSGNAPKVTVTGDVGREYIYVKDLCKALWCAVTHGDLKGIFNVGSGDSVSIAQLAELIDLKLGKGQGIEKSESLKQITEFTLMDSSAFQKAFKWTPQWNISEALDDMAKDIKS